VRKDKGSGSKQPTEETGKRFREGYYKHHGLNQGRMCTPEENKACLGIVMLVLGKKLSEAEGQERIKEILHPEVPF